LLKIPAAPVFDMGCDGGFTEIEIGDYSGKAHYRWWSIPPRGWEELSKIAQEGLRIYGAGETIENGCRTVAEFS